MFQSIPPRRSSRRSHTVRRRSARTVLSTAAFFCSLGLLVPAVAHADGSSDVPKVAFERYTLDNGLEVILHKDSRVPLVTVDVWYHVGSGDEVINRSGFAHLFEHMLFQGSKNVGSDKHFSTLKKVGSSQLNGTTNTDRTNYYETVPSNQLETALWLESDRMGYLLPMLTKESLDNQIEVVRNERRQRVDNVPYGSSFMAMTKAMYPEGHPYRYSVIGRHEDLAAATLDDVRNFYKKWYVPSNATLALAGDFEIDEAKRLVQKWFGTFPKSQRPTHKRVPMPKIKRQRIEVPDKLAKLRKLAYAWHTPAFLTDGDAEFDILADALGRRGTGRLYKILVHEKRLAQQLFVSQRSAQLSSTFQIDILLSPTADLAEVERIVNEELNKVRTQDISQTEFDRAFTGIESSFVWGLESLLARAELLQRYNHYLGTPDYIEKDLARYTSSSPGKVRELAAKYLNDDHRIELITMPSAGGSK